MEAPGDAKLLEARRTARRQLRRLIALMAVLDLAILLLVIAVAYERSTVGLSTSGVLAVVGAGAAAVIGTRIWLAARLRTHAGNLR